MSELELFLKRKEFLVCIDSDGCAMDTMDCKHFRCFGPCAVEEWKLEPWKKEVLDYWNQVNLYTMTRGANRFLALSMVLEWVHDNCGEIEGVKVFSEWAKEARELSNTSVKSQYEKTGEKIFYKALCWSQAVNLSILDLPEELKKPFDGVKEGVEMLHGQADVAIVSSANREAVVEEWERFSLMGWVDLCLTQTEGSKAWCIGEMVKKGYTPSHVLMIGDAPGDERAAAQNGVLFYPILVKQEAKSWRRLVQEALPRFLEGSYEGAYEAKLKQEFLENLS